MAKLFRIKVEEFAFGFGPKWIILFNRGGTEYTVHPVPLGGFVKLAGMDPREVDVPDGFTSKPWWIRFLVHLAGPVMSFLLAYIVFSTLGLTMGIPCPVNKVEFVQPKSIAERAGLRAGDRIVRIGSEPIESGDEMVRIIHGSAYKPLVLVIDRGGKSVEIRATPMPGKRGKKIGLIGFIPAHEIRRVGFFRSIQYGTVVTVDFLKFIVVKLFSREIKENIGGPIAIVAATEASLESGFYHFIRLIGILSLSLAVVNLLPIPVIDGGQMLLLVVEGLKRRRLSPRTWEIAQRIGFAAIAVIIALVMYLDLSRVATGKLF